MNSSITIGLWNVQWASGGSTRGAFFRHQFAGIDADILAVTEGFSSLFADGGHVISSKEDYGYPIKLGRRKVLLWSRHPWTDVDQVGNAELPSGRFVAATTATALGPVRFVGVCIPWKDAHVRSGRKDRRPWEDHLAFLTHLASVIRRPSDVPVVVLGDFNQRVPRKGQPAPAFSALELCFADPFQIVTGGEITGTPHFAIDHVAMDTGLVAPHVAYLDSHDATGSAMSDHFGLKVTVTRRPAVS